MFKKKKKILTPEQAEEIRIQEFLTVSFRVQSDFSPIILSAEICINVCGRSESGRRLRKNKQSLLTLLTEIP